MRPGAPAIHGDKDAATARIGRPERNVVVELHSELGDVAAAFADGGLHPRADLPHPAGGAHRAGDPRLHRLDRRRRPAPGPHLQPGAVPGPAHPGPGLRPAGGPDPGGHGTGGRRLRRQAGSPHRGHRGPRRAETAAARAARIHPHRAVHGRHHPAPVHHPPQGRRQQRRQADGPAAGGPDQRRRLRQPLRGRDVPRLRRIAGRVQLRQQESGRARRVHQHGALGRLPRLRAEPDDLRDRVRRRRARHRNRHGPDGVPPPQHGPRGRRHALHAPRTGRGRALRQLRAGPVHAAGAGRPGARPGTLPRTPGSGTSARSGSPGRARRCP